MEEVVALTPPHICDPKIAVAACRAGGIGILDLGYKNDPDSIHEGIETLAELAGTNGRWGVRWDTFGDQCGPTANSLADFQGSIPTLILAGVPARSLIEALDKSRKLAGRIVLEVTSPSGAEAARHAGYDGLLVKGNESGGRVGRLGSYLFLQHLKKGGIKIPYWMQGGIGLHTAAAALLAGASGVVLCEQLWMTKETPFSELEMEMFARLDGGETVCIGSGDVFFRCFSRSGRNRVREVEMIVASGNGDSEAGICSCLCASGGSLMPMGQDIAFASDFAKRFGTVGKTIIATRQSINEHLRLAIEQRALGPDSPLAVRHGTRYPITQGPMARVSDVVSFAKSVAKAGALPFLAFSLMKGPEVRTLLKQAKSQMGAMPWGAGVLGFLPQHMRKEQLEALSEIPPPFAIIAGGRPAQALELESLGISSYLHVPSPRMLEIAIEQGIRKFVFEGSECGGHIGPRTSLVLWESAVSLLLDARIDKPEEVQVLFAGGIHDSLSANMAAAIAAPLVARGMRIGVQMGSAYLLTHEIVQSGATVPEFQKQLLRCNTTAVLQSGIGHASRCALTPFVDEFYRTKLDLMRAGKSDEEIRLELETINLGRLRIASRGVARTENSLKAADLTNLDEATQQREGMYMAGQVCELHSTPFSVADLHASVSESSTRVLSEAVKDTGQEKSSTKVREAVAVIGMACVFPEAPDVGAYWRNILNQVSTIKEVDPDRWNPDAMFTPDRTESDRSYSKWGSFLHDVPFDPMKYGIPPSSLAAIDPVQLLALQVASQALEDAGLLLHNPHRERTSVFFGAGGPNQRTMEYGLRTSLLDYISRAEEIPLESRERVIESIHRQLPVWTEDSFPGFLDNVVTGRITNRLDLGGSNYTLNAACATSFAALEVGVRQLQSHDCDVAIVGAADTNNNILSYLSFARVQAMSPTGLSRPFDHSADGMVLGEGVGAVVLKRLKDAERDGDRIHAVIRGIGSSSDGRNRSLTAPHSGGQIKALERAYADAGLPPNSIELVEAHGTGTPLGDQTEINTLKSVFDAGETTERQYCAVGSVKSMIGHTKLAAGIASLIKCVLALKHKTLPPTIGVDKPASSMDFPNSPFYIVKESRPWIRRNKREPRRAASSCFGFGGANFHVVVEEYTGDLRDSSKMDLASREAEVFSIARAKRADIEASLRQLIEKLGGLQTCDMPQLAYSHFLEERKTPLRAQEARCRLSIVAGSIDDLRRKLEQALKDVSNSSSFKKPLGIYYSESDPVNDGVCFLFPGQGAQRINMLRDLVMGNPSALRSIENADELLKGKFGPPLSQYIYPVPVFSDAERDRQQRELDDTHVAQPAIGLIDMIAVDILAKYGIKPDFTAGHSYGEYIALTIAGALSREEALLLSESRGRIVKEACASTPGIMAAVIADETKTVSILEELGLTSCLANLNSPEQTIIGGPEKIVEEAVRAFNSRGVRANKIPVHAAFHTPFMEKSCDMLRQVLAKVNFRKPELKVFSNTTAGPYPESADEIREVLARHLCNPVYFSKQIKAMFLAGAKVFIEAGPRRILTNLVDQTLAGESYTALNLDVPDRSGWLQLAHVLAQGAAAGLPVNLAPWFDGRRLKKIGIDEAIEQARVTSTCGNRIWRLNGSKIRPWNEELSKEEVKATMKSTENKEAEAGIEPADAGAVSRMHSIMAEFIELHRDQQRVMHRFLDIYGGMLQASSGADIKEFARVAARPVPQPPAGAVAQEHAPSERPTAGPPVVTGGVPPAPVIPKLPPQITGAVVGPAPIRSPNLPFDLPAEVHGASSMLSTSPGIQQRPKPGLMPSQYTPAVSKGASRGDEIPAREEFQEYLLGQVRERTGYPMEMLALDAHMESDLGIDSIKKIEIFAGMKNHYAVMRNMDDESLLEELANLTTLRSIIEWYDAGRTGMLEAAGSASPLPPAAPVVKLMPPKEGGAQSPVPVISATATPLPAVHNDVSVPHSMSSAAVEPLDIKPMLPASRSQFPASCVEVAVEPVDLTPPLPASCSPLPEDLSSDPIRRLVVKPALASIDNDSEIRSFPSDHVILLLGHAPDFISYVSEGCGVAAGRIIQVVPGDAARLVGSNRYEVDFSSFDSIRELRAMIAESGDKVGAIFNLIPVSRPIEEPGRDYLGDAAHLFLVLKVFGEDLHDAGRNGGGWLVNFTAMGGRFALDGRGSFPLGQAGTVGLAKSIAREWPDIRVKSIDLDLCADPRVLAPKIVQELAKSDSLVEVGLNEEGRWKIDLVEEDQISKVHTLRLLDQESVVLIMGGAYGVTSEVSKVLASRYQPRIILVGRSLFHDDESQETKDLLSVQELRQYFIARSIQEDRRLTPAAIEKEVRHVIRTRKIKENIAEMTEAGAKVEYHSLDVRDAQRFGELIDRIYEQYGRIDGVVHGSGINEDKLVRDKSVESFSRVFDTKVVPAKVLSERLRPEGLKFVVFFSSVAARFGNAGQSDYSAANEVLNKLAVRLSNTWQAHVLAINWGPWDSGMVNEDLGRLFADRGIHLIPKAEGAKMFLAELNCRETSIPEVLISRSVKRFLEQ